MRTAVSTTTAPQAIGPYSQAIRAGNLLFLSGQIPLDPATGQLVEGDIAIQTARVLDNLSAVLQASVSLPLRAKVKRLLVRRGARSTCSTSRSPSPGAAAVRTPTRR